MNKALMFFITLLVVSPAMAAEQDATESLSPLEKQEQEEGRKEVSSLTRQEFYWNEALWKLKVIA